MITLIPGYEFTPDMLVLIVNDGFNITNNGIIAKLVKKVGSAVDGDGECMYAPNGRRMVDVWDAVSLTRPFTLPDGEDMEALVEECELIPLHDVMWAATQVLGAASKEPA